MTKKTQAEIEGEREANAALDDYPTPSIDNPPREPKQEKLLKEDPDAAHEDGPKQKISVTVKIEEMGAKIVHSYPVLRAEEIPCDRILEMLVRGMASPTVAKFVLDNSGAQQPFEFPVRLRTEEAAAEGTPNIDRDEF